MTSKNILAVTGTRADYGLLSKTLKKINESNILSLSLCVTGTHLSKDFGMTKKFINEDGIRIDHQINIINENLNENSVSHSVGLMIQNFSKYLEELRPDLILLLGDRYEIFSATIAAYLNHIPIVHIYGGETTQGSLDEGIRHSITKLSNIHFVSLIHW